MKVKLIYLHNNLTEHIPFDAEILEGKIYIEGEMLPFTSSITNKKTILIIEYEFSDLYKLELGVDANAKFTYQTYNGSLYVYSKLTWFQKQQLNYMFGEHIIISDDNFKWIIGGLGTLLVTCVTFYLTNQNSKLEEQSKIINNLKDSLNKCQNLANHKLK